MKRIEPDAANQPPTHANGILSGDDLFVAGQVGIDPTTGKPVDGIGAQTAVALTNFVSVVKTAGGDVGDVAKLTIYVADMDAFHKEADAVMSAFAASFAQGHIPAMTLVGVTALMSPEFLIEIEGHAKVGASAA